MIEPIEKEIDGKTYIISKFPAVAGREIVAKYPLSGMPKLGDYAVNEETMLKLMKYVCVITPSGQLALSSKDLIDNHIQSWETLARLEWTMLEYNCSFFRDGRISSFFRDFLQKLPAWISKTLTGLSVPLSPVDLQPTENSKKSTRSKMPSKSGKS